MLYALSHGNKIGAYPKGRAVCPSCYKEVIAKCGEINIHHWAHKVKGDCDIWGEETEWHRRWKSHFPKENVEVVIEKDGQKHRADLLLADGSVIEFQKSHISPADIRKRESFYGDVAWIFNALDASERFSFNNKGNYWTFRWKHARKSLLACEGTVLLDVNRCEQRYWHPYKERYIPAMIKDTTSVFIVKKIHPDPVAGWGRFLPRTKLIEMLLKQCNYQPTSSIRIKGTNENN